MNLTPLINAGPVVQFHVAGAMGAFFTGALNLSRRKGDPLHRATGVLVHGCDSRERAFHH